MFTIPFISVAYEFLLAFREAVNTKEKTNMAKFASSAKTARKVPGRTPVVNAAGGVGFSQSAKLELVSLMLTSFVQDQFYRTESGTIVRLKELMGKVDPLFAAKAAVFARNEFGMRSISHIVAAPVVCAAAAPCCASAT